MKDKFVPINTDRAEKLDKADELEEANSSNQIIRILAWVDSPEELELMQRMSDDELEAYLDRKRKGQN